MDRSWRNPNLLLWHGDVWLIDHGAALWFHHNWPTADPLRGYDASDHVLAPFATRVAEVDAEFSELITRDLLDGVVDGVPDEWLEDEPGFDGAQAVRQAYVEHLLARAQGPRTWLPEPSVTSRQEKKTGSVGAFWKGNR